MIEGDERVNHHFREGCDKSLGRRVFHFFPTDAENRAVQMDRGGASTGKRCDSAVIRSTGKVPLANSSVRSKEDLWLK